MARELWTPDAIDTNVPSVARMYDYLLGGSDNYASDREACELLLKQVPSSKALAVNNRHFLRRVVRVLAKEYGIRQFIDHGSGLPTQDNVHQVAQAVDPASRVVYVDNDPIVLAHGRALLDENDRTAVIQADMRDTDGIFGHEETRRLIDFSRPVAALFVSVLHCIPDQDDPGALVRRVAERLVPGSFLVVCQLVSDRPEIRAFVTDFMAEATGGHWGRVREEHEVTEFLTGLEILEPGLVEVSTWRPDNDLAPVQQTDEWVEWGGVGRIV
ncbi:SAM-dependent methyltransferase [Streptomyces sp. WAC05374]|uniref:SAM-dependent methyltransferase n=1 Tax=Streptomyces sp. WAC05374 TaxID=2487420 RepID=UPI000F867432|nr:SAM-dependent methyltransferase [Streptomyces sp. WAC05374]RST05242.1 SAM-dependent methyltransferase [Streptomyces sp. WAC05374]TDF54507.1 SAM-dependent methyltransferase [Streptomyces sp. WAC05374]TDF56142.1 SAM-dependent methyltransferase [Streptomyces sp. WAC05374]